MEQPIRVAFIDEHLLFLEALAARLNAEPGFTVVGTAVDADTGLDLVCHAQPEIAVFDVVLPGRHLVEKDGTLTNCDGRVQRVSRAMPPPGAALCEGAIVARLGAAMHLDGFDGDFEPGSASRALAAAFPAFAGCELDALPADGRPLAGAEEG